MLLRAELIGPKDLPALIQMVSQNGKKKCIWRCDSWKCIVREYQSGAIGRPVQETVYKKATQLWICHSTKSLKWCGKLRERLFPVFSLSCFQTV